MEKKELIRLLKVMIKELEAMGTNAKLMNTSEPLTNWKRMRKAYQCPTCGEIDWFP